MIITIDGPTASGKSSAARVIAQRLSLYYLYSGLLYRAVAYVLVQKQGYLETHLQSPDEAHIAEICEHISYSYTPQSQERIHYQGQDITAHLKSEHVDRWTPQLSAQPIVRQHILSIQQGLAKKYALIADGRDCGSVVFPQATMKFYLTASIEVRARRWLNDQLTYGNNFSLEEAIVAIEARDARDINRSLAPLIVPHGAMIIDTAPYTLPEVVDQIVTHITTATGTFKNCCNHLSY